MSQKLNFIEYLKQGQTKYIVHFLLLLALMTGCSGTMENTTRSTEIFTYDDTKDINNKVNEQLTIKTELNNASSEMKEDTNKVEKLMTELEQMRLKNENLRKQIVDLKNEVEGASTSIEMRNFALTPSMDVVAEYFMAQRNNSLTDKNGNLPMEHLYDMIIKGSSFLHDYLEADSLPSTSDQMEPIYFNEDGTKVPELESYYLVSLESLDTLQEIETYLSEFYTMELAAKIVDEHFNHDITEVNARYIVYKSKIFTSGGCRGSDAEYNDLPNLGTGRILEYNQDEGRLLMKYIVPVVYTDVYETDKIYRVDFESKEIEFLQENGEWKLNTVCQIPWGM